MAEVQRIIGLSRPDLGEPELCAVREVFRTGYLGMGRQVEQLERALTDFCGRQAVCVSSGTAALHLAMESMGIQEGDEVLVSSLTFAATFQAIAATGALPVPCDVREDDLAIDLKAAEAKCTGRCKALVPVHYAGYPGDLDALYRFARQKGLRVIEDAAHAFGGSYRGARLGSAGDVTCFSFDPVKTITCGEGGAVVTSDPAVLDGVRSRRFLGLRNGRSPLASADFVSQAVDPGWRYHMSNINAAIGLVQLGRFESLKTTRQELARRYVKRLQGSRAIELLPFDFTSVVPYIFVVKLRNGDNTRVIRTLRERGIEAAYHYFPCHLHPYFRHPSGCRLPVVESLFPRLLTLPLHPALTPDDIDTVADALLNTVGE